MSSDMADEEDGKDKRFLRCWGKEMRANEGLNPCWHADSYPNALENG